MKRKVIAAFLIALVAEVAASWWMWLGAPTDGLRPLYEMSFLKFEAERIFTWSIVFGVLGLAWLLVEKRTSLK
jgi:hypothetical protein